MWWSVMGCIITLSLSLCAAPLAAHAQPPTHVHRIGWLSGATLKEARKVCVPEFLEGMHALGYVEGQHFILEYRRAEGQNERFPALAAELVHLKVDVLMVWSMAAALAAKHATTTIPIVMGGAADPLGSGLVASLARPGGNITGLSVIGSRSRRETAGVPQGCAPHGL